MTERIKFLDGFRGLAILLVITFHCFVTWSKVLPYGTTFSSFPIFKNGWLGVELFFLISGFVILMTLERSSNFFQFIIKRWLRLFPSMLIVTLIIYFTANFFYERPYGIPRLRDILPGLLFIDQGFIREFLNIDINVIEGSFWSLFIETKFYVIFGLLFFYKGKNNAIVIIFILFLMSVVVSILLEFTNLSMLPKLRLIMDRVGFSYYGWFASGSLLYLYYQNKDKMYLIYSILIVILSILKVSKSIDVFIYASIISSLFIITVCNDKCKILISNRFFTYVGFVSYPLYLIHENMLISLIIKVKRHFLYVPDILLPIIPIVFLIIISHIIVKFIEPPLHGFLKNRIKFIKQ